MPDPAPSTGSVTAAGPYAAAASLYRSLGWAGVLPVVGKHDHLPAGYTGRRGAWPDDVTVGGWVAGRGGDNVALRVPPDVIGIDVDAYDGRRGLQTLEAFEERFGMLPATWTCSARRDGSGIRFYRVPAGLTWVGELGAGSNVEVIQTVHRYAVVWPSVHPGNHPGDPVRGEPYRWTDPAGSTSPAPPKPADLPELPEAWVGALRKDGGAAPGEPDGRSHRGEDGEITDLDGQHVDPHLLLHGAVPPGEQQNRLFSYLCSLRARNAHRDEMVLLGLAAMSRFENGDAANPWGAEHVTEMVDRIRDEYPPGSSATLEVSPELVAWARAVGTGAATVEERPEAAPNATDTGNAARFARLYADELRYAGDVGRWYRWDGRRWAQALEVEVLGLTAAIPDLIRADGELDAARRDEWGRWASRSESAPARSAVVKLAATRPELLIAAADLDADPDLLVVENGTVDLRTGELRPSRREDLGSRLAAVRFDAAAGCDLWRDHVWKVTGGRLDDYRYLQRALGYTLTGHVDGRTFFFLRGDGRNGKNALVEPVLRLMGDYASAEPARLLGGGEEHPTLLTNLLGVRLAFVDELPDRRALNVERLKSLSGGAAAIKARYIAGNYFEFPNRLKLWLTCNGEPPIPDDSAAVWDRMHLVECRTRFGPGGQVPAVPGFKERLYAEEAPGILNWLLEGQRAWRDLDRELEPPAGVRQAVEEYRSEEQHLDRWITEALEPCDPELFFLSNVELTTSWQLWAATNGVPRRYADAVTPGKMGHALRRRGYASAVVKRNRNPIRGRAGVRILGNSGSGVTDRPEGPPR